MAIHCALNFDVIKRLKTTRRVTDVVSRGGAFLTGWMLHNNKENPLYEQFDRLLDILRRYDVTLSLGDAIRPGCTADSPGWSAIAGDDYWRRVGAKGTCGRRAEIMVEGPGHVPMHHVRATMQLQKRLCNGAPYFVLGTLATDVAPGYDHITSAIGGAIAGAAGADFICNVTPAEHLGLPTEQDVKDGTIAARIAAHAADLAKGNKRALAKDLQMARARVALDLDRQIALSIDSEKLAANREKGDGTHCCAVCGPQCAALVAAKYFGIAVNRDWTLFATY